MRRPDFGMSEPNDFDDGLENLFTRAAAETPDGAFAAQVMGSLQRRDRTRILAVAGAGLAGAMIAAMQLGSIRALLSPLGERASAALGGAAPQAEGMLAGASPMTMAAAVLLLLAVGGVTALVRR